MEQSCPCSDLQAVLRDISIKLAVLQTKMEALEQLQVEMETLQKQTHEHAVTLAVNQVKLELLETLDHEQAVKVEKNQIQIQELQTLGREQAAEMKEFEARVDSQQQVQDAELRNLKTQTDDTETQLDSLRRERAVSRVAFSAALLPTDSGTFYTGPFDTDTTLVFKQLISNIGEAYSPFTGVFTAPVGGAYQFDFHIAGNSPAALAELVKNGERVVTAEEHQTGGLGTTANGATLELQPGDVVFLRLRRGFKIYDNGEHYSTFSGRLLFTI